MSQEMIEPPAPPLVPRRQSRWKWVIIGFLAVALAIGGWFIWYFRPIKPVQLGAKEKTVLEAKVVALEKPVEPAYVKGSREIVLTERELNGLLHERTTLGNSLSFQLATDAILARVETDLDNTLPVVGGRQLKARARFLVGKTDGQASLILDDLTVWGISLPNDWLAGMKGRDLLAEMLGSKEGSGIAGIEDIKVEPGRLMIRLAE